MEGLAASLQALQRRVVEGRELIGGGLRSNRALKATEGAAYGELEPDAAVRGSAPGARGGQGGLGGREQLAAALSGV